VGRPGEPPSSKHPAPNQPSLSSPADVNGGWFIGARGVGGTRLLLKTDGTILTGMLWQREETDGYPIHDGTVHGNAVSFKVTVQVPDDGRSGMHSVTNSYSGTLTVDKLDLTWTSGVDSKVVRPQKFSRCDSSGPNACHLGKKIG
jgi:hypothetical protein